MKSIQTRQITSSFAKALKEALGRYIHDEHMLNDVLKTNASLTCELIEALSETHNQGLLGDVMKELPNVLEKGMLDKDIAYVISSIEIDRDNKIKIANSLRKKFGENVKAQFVHDEKIAGGFLVKYKDMKIDLTVQSKLKDFLQNLTK